MRRLCGKVSTLDDASTVVGCAACTARYGEKGLSGVFGDVMQTCAVMKNLLLSITALAVLGAPALAADLARPIDKAPAPAVFNWSGCYIGVSGGGIWARSQEDWVPSAGILSPLLISNGSGPIAALAASPGALSAAACKVARRASWVSRAT